MRRVVNLYLFAVREYADERALDRIEAALEPPNRLDPITGVPHWWVSDDAAWDAFTEQLTS